MAEQLEYFAINTFHGLRTNQSTRTMDAGDAQIAEEIDFSQAGVLQGRATDVAQFNNGSINAIAAYGSDLIISTTSTKLYNLSTELHGSWGGWFDHFKIGDWVYMGNGTTMRRTDGTNDYSVGITAPASAPTVATGAAGALTGDYYYKVTYVDSDSFESNASAASSLVQPSSEKVDLSSIPTGAADEDVAKRKIYRTEAGGSTYYLVTTINDNSTTTYTDNTTDANLTLTSPPTNHDVPEPTIKLIDTCQDRWFGSPGNTKLYYSLPFPNERGMPSTYYLDFPDTIMAVKAIGHLLLVLCKTGPYILSGLSDPDAFYYRRLSTRFYPKSVRVTTIYKGGILSQGTEGLMYSSASESILISEKIRNLLSAPGNVAQATAGFDMLFLLPSEIEATAETGEVVKYDQDGTAGTFASDHAGDVDFGICIRIQTSGDFYDFSGEYGIVINVGSFNAPQIIVGDMRTGELEWSYYQIDCAAIGFDKYNQTLYVGDSTGVRSLSSSPTAWTWKNGDCYLGHPNRYKQLYKLYIGYSDCTTLVIDVYADGSSTSSDTITLSNCDGPQEVDFDEKIWGVTFSVKMVGTGGSVHAPVMFKIGLGDFV